MTVSSNGTRKVTGKFHATFLGHPDKIYDAVLVLDPSSCHGWIASASGDGTIALFHSQISDVPRYRFVGHKSTVVSISDFIIFSQ